MDVAEVFALRMLQCLQDRVRKVYAPGVQVWIRIENLCVRLLATGEGEGLLPAVNRYSTDLIQLIKVLGLDFVKPMLETNLMDEDEYLELVRELIDPIAVYLTESDAYGLDKYTELPSWKALASLGWRGSIPVEQRDFYRSRYARLYPDLSARERTLKLAEYLASSLARHKLKGTGAQEGWNGNFIQLNFCSPVPGMPSSMAQRVIHYRTIPAQMSKLHVPPWRAKGFLIVGEDKIHPRLIGYGGEMPDLQEYAVKYRAGDMEVVVRADYRL